MLASLISIVPRTWVGAFERWRWRSGAIEAFLKALARSVKDRDTVIQAGVGKGLRINVGMSAGSFVLGNHEMPLQELLRAVLAPGNTFVDIGANVGFCSLIASRVVGPDGAVVSIEAFPSNARLLRHNASLNGFGHMSVFETAAGAADGQASFATSERPTWGKLTSVGKRPEHYEGDIVVPLARLDTLMTRNALRAPDVIKIDVEGSELDVLAGAETTVHAAQPIVVAEMHGTNVEWMRAMSRLNYYAATLDPTFDSVRTAHWNAVVVAAPQRKLDRIPPALRRRMRPASAEFTD